MWEVTDENRRLLSSWAASCDDPKRRLLADSIVKVSPLIFFYISCSLSVITEVMFYCNAEVRINH